MSVAYQFQAGQVDALGSFQALPEGQYVVAIIGSKLIDKEGKQALSFEMKVQQGDLAGREIRERANLVGYNDTAVEMGQKTLESICRAVGVAGFASTGELHGRLFQIKVVKEDNADDNGKVTSYTRIKGWFNAAGVDVSDIVPGAAPAVAAPVAPAAPAPVAPVAPIPVAPVAAPVAAPAVAVSVAPATSVAPAGAWPAPAAPAVAQVAAAPVGNIPWTPTA